MDTAGWVGLSDITALGGGDFLIVERDNQGGPDAAIKKIYGISLGDIDSVPDGSTITKTLASISYFEANNELDQRLPEY